MPRFEAWTSWIRSRSCTYSKRQWLRYGRNDT